MEKICSKCKLPKDINDFYNDKSRSDGKSNKCIVCVKNYSSSSTSMKNLRLSGLVPYREISEKTCSICKDTKDITFFQKNSHNSDEYTSRCKDCLSEINTSSANRKRINMRDKQVRINDPKQELYYKAKKRAKQQNVPFTISKEDIILPKKCPILGLILRVNKDKAQADSYSLDRIVPELGYVKNNIDIISFRANTIKSDGTAEEHKAIAEYIEARTLSGPVNTNPDLEFGG